MREVETASDGAEEDAKDERLAVDIEWAVAAYGQRSNRRASRTTHETKPQTSPPSAHEHTG